jgi:hypothetical protein
MTTSSTPPREVRKPPRRLTPPWTVTETPGGYRVNDSDNHHIAYVYCKDDHQVPMMPEYLTRDGARRVAKAIARLPELLKPGTKSST